MHNRILVADDDAQMRSLLREELFRDGYDVVTAADGVVLLELLSGIARAPFAVPDAIIMDVRLPGYSGLHVLAALRNAGWGTPVILITAFGDERTHSEAMKLGATTTLDKPFDIDDLRVAVLHATSPEKASNRLA